VAVAETFQCLGKRATTKQVATCPRNPRGLLPEHHASRREPLVARLAALLPRAYKLLGKDRVRKILFTVVFVTGFYSVSAAQNASEPVATFGTTVVDTAGFHGQIYYLKPNTGILPDSFKRLKPKGTIYTRSLNVTPRHFTQGFPGVTKRFEWFAIDYTGNFWIERPGVYQFALTSDDGSLLYIDDQLLIDNDRIHPAQTKTANLALDRKAHTIRVSYFQGPRDEVALILQVAGPGEKLHVFSMDEFKPHSD